MMYNVSVKLFIIRERRKNNMKKMKIFAAVLLAASMLAGCGANGNLNKTAIEVGDVKVKAGDVAIMTLATTSYSGQSFDAAKTQLADQIETSFKYGALGEAMGIELSDDDKKSAIEIRANYASQNGGYKEYKKFLADNGSSIEFLDKLFTASAYQTKINETINEELAKTEATDDELKAYFNENYLRAKHVLVNKEPQEEGEKAGKEFAEELLGKAKAGEDFDAMIKEYSKDPGSASKPDGYVFTDGEMVAEFEETVKNLKPGEFGICETTYGYHIIQRLDLNDFEGNRDAVASKYELKRLEKKFNAMCEEKGIKSVINKDVIDALKEDMLKVKEVAEEAVAQ